MSALLLSSLEKRGQLFLCLVGLGLAVCLSLGGVALALNGDIGANNLVARAATQTGSAYTALNPSRILDTRSTNSPLRQGGSLSVDVLVGQVPQNATAVALNVTVTNTTTASYLSVYPAGEATPTISNLNWTASETVANLVIVPVGTGGKVSFYNDLGAMNLIVDLEGYFAPGQNSNAGGYVPLTPVRLADTRDLSGEPNANSTLGANSTLNVQVTGVGGVPTTGVAAVVLNVTATDSTASSYFTVYPQGTNRLLASNLNWSASETVANRVIVPVSASGQISIYNQLGHVDAIVDVSGYFTNGSVIEPGVSFFNVVNPSRLLDTRLTYQSLYAPAVLTQQVAGLSGIASNATAVVANVTVTNTTQNSYLTVYPSGVAPLASDLNWNASQTVANLSLMTLGSSGQTTFFNKNGTTDIVVDLFGYFVPATPLPLAVISSDLSTANVGVAYSTSLKGYGGTPSYKWSVIGEMPSGFSLSSDGIISGTASSLGSTTFTVQMTDATLPTPETTTAQLTLQVIPSATTISGIDLHDGDLLEYQGTYYLYGTEYGCGFQWLVWGTHWCGFGVSTASSINGPWSAPTLLFNPDAVVDTGDNNWAIDNGKTWQFVCVSGKGGIDNGNEDGPGPSGCFEPRMLLNPQGQWELWFNAPDDYYRNNNNVTAEWVLGCQGPTGECGSAVGEWDHKPNVPLCISQGSPNIVVDGTTAALICSNAITQAPIVEALNSTWTDGTSQGSSWLGDPVTNAESADEFQLPNGTWELTEADTTCGYCSGPPKDLTAVFGATEVHTGYATGPTMFGPFTFQGVLSPTWCTGEPNGLVTVGSQVYEWVDEWTGSRNETTASILLEPMQANPWSCTGG